MYGGWDMISVLVSTLGNLSVTSQLNPDPFLGVTEFELHPQNETDILIISVSDPGQLSLCSHASSYFIKDLFTWRKAVPGRRVILPPSHLTCLPSV